MGSTLTVRIEAPYVIKELVPDICAIEARRTEAAREVAKKSDLFIVPEVLDVDIAAGLLVLEYIPELTHPLHSSIVRSKERAAIYRKIGWAIGTLHTELDIDSCITRGARIGGGVVQDKDVVLHGDCHPGHTLWSKRDNKVVVIDWSGMYKPGDRPTVGTFGPWHRDILYWVSQMVVQIITRRSLIGALRSASLSEEFIRGYENGVGVNISRKWLREECLRKMKAGIIKKKYAQEGTFRAHVSSAGKMILMVFIGKLLFRWQGKDLQEAG